MDLVAINCLHYMGINPPCNSPFSDLIAVLFALFRLQYYLSFFFKVDAQHHIFCHSQMFCKPVRVNQISLNQRTVQRWCCSCDGLIEVKQSSCNSSPSWPAAEQWAGVLFLFPALCCLIKSYYFPLQICLPSYFIY